MFKKAIQFGIAAAVAHCVFVIVDGFGLAVIQVSLNRLNKKVNENHEKVIKECEKELEKLKKFDMSDELKKIDDAFSFILKDKKKKEEEEEKEDDAE